MAGRRDKSDASNQDLFSAAVARDPARVDPEATPLAERMRPRSLDELVGQAALLGDHRPLRRAIESDRVPSMILWGPPGAGKTTLARLVATATKARFEAYSAVLGSVAEVREILARAREARGYRRERTILFVDEIHRFNRAQQDAFLPAVEDGTVTLIGATTENPSFAVNAALLSRCRTFRLEPLPREALEALLRRALEDEERGLGKSGVRADDEAIAALVALSTGDARRALTALEISVDFALAEGHAVLTRDWIARALAAPGLRYDKKGDEHYGVVSAFIKSMRGSDVDAALYWMARMLEAGEDPLFVSRRLLIFASEDVGNADPRALTVAVAADEAFRRMGMPEGIHPLAQACAYLATAPKSNASIAGYQAAAAAVATHGSLEVPAHLRPSTGAAAKREGWGAGYVYTQDEPEAFSASQRYLPTELLGERFYQPRGAGYEAQIKTRLEAWRARREGTSEAGFEARASSVESRDEPAPEASGPRGE